MGLMQSNLERNGCFLDFNLTNGWIQYLYNPMKFTRKLVTTSRLKINLAAWAEVKQFLFVIIQTEKKHNILSKFIFNVNQNAFKT